MNKNTIINDKITKRMELLPTLSRTSPVLFFIIILLNSIVYPSYESCYLFICYFLAIISNHIFKNLFSKPLYNLLNTKSLPLLGIGDRPPNARGCSHILTNKLSTSYGMPSGHSQITWTICSYLLFKIINNWYTIKNNNKINKTINIFEYIWIILSCILLLITSIYISYSRVYIEGCHTIQQVTVGGILGIISGFLIYYFENDAIKLLSKIY